MVSIACIILIASAFGYIARKCTPPRASVFFWPMAVVGFLADLLIGYLVVFVVLGLTLGYIRLIVDPLQPLSNPPIYETIAINQIILFYLTVPLVAVAYHWLRTHWATPSWRWYAIVAACLALTVFFHYAFVEHGTANYGHRALYDPPPPHAWFGWVGDMYPASPIFWFGPRFSATPLREAICLICGLCVPTVLSAGALCLAFWNTKSDASGE